MGTYLDHGNVALYFYYDLEFVSPKDITNGVCGKEQIWEIGAFHPVSQRSFSKLVKVENLEYGIQPPAGEKVHIKRALEEFVEFVGPHAILISHNNFRSDKPILENASKKVNVQLPMTWLFFDSLLFLRTQIKSQKYSLEYLCNKTMSHRALEDCLDLAFLLRNAQLSGPMYPPYVTALQRCKWLGTCSEKALMRHGVRSLENLVCLLYSANKPVLHTLMAFGINLQTAQPIANELLKTWMPRRKNIQL